MLKGIYRLDYTLVKMEFTVIHNWQPSQVYKNLMKHVDVIQWPFFSMFVTRMWCVVCWRPPITWSDHVMYIRWNRFFFLNLIKNSPRFLYTTTLLKSPCQRYFHQYDSCYCWKSYIYCYGSFIFCIFINLSWSGPAGYNTISQLMSFRNHSILVENKKVFFSLLKTNTVICDRLYAPARNLEGHDMEIHLKKGHCGKWQKRMVAAILRWTMYWFLWKRHGAPQERRGAASFYFCSAMSAKAYLSITCWLHPLRVYPNWIWDDQISRWRSHGP